MEADKLLLGRTVLNALLGVVVLVMSCCCGFAEPLIVVPVYKIPRSVLSSVGSIDEIKVIPVEASPHLLIVHNIRGKTKTQDKLFLVDLQDYGIRSIELPSELLLLDDLAVSKKLHVCVSGIYSGSDNMISRFPLRKIWCKQEDGNDWFVLTSSSDPTVGIGALHFVNDDTVLFSYYGASFGKDRDSVCSGSLSQRHVRNCFQLPLGVGPAWKMVNADRVSVVVANYFGSLYNYQWVRNDVIGVTRKPSWIHWFVIEQGVNSSIALSSSGEALSWHQGAWSSVTFNVPKALLPLQVLATLAPGKALISDSERKRCSVVTASTSTVAADFPCGGISNSLIVRAASDLVVIQLDGRGGVNIGKLKVEVAH